jgi:carboxymethylenebutenolidase
MEAPLHTEYVTFPSAAGEVRGYLARLEGSERLPALLVLSEWTGLIPYIEDVSRRLAREGYLALAPDLYSGDPVRAGMDVDDLEMATEVGRAPTVEAGLEEVPPDHREAVRRAHEWRRARTGENHVPFMLGTLAYLQSRPDVIREAIGSIGFCMGGRLSATLATTGAELAAAAIFYGPNPPIKDVPNVRCPVEGHYGSEDPSVTLKVPLLDEAMKAAGKQFNYYVYKGAPHAFHNDTRKDYHREASLVSWARVLEFLDKNVKCAVASAR